MQGEARASGWDRGLEGWDPGFSLTLPPTCQATSVSPDVAGVGEEHYAQVTQALQTYERPKPTLNHLGSLGYRAMEVRTLGQL